MLQAIRPGVSAGLTPPLPGFLSLPAFYIPYYWRSPCSRQSRGIYVYSINTGLLFYSPDLLDYHDYIYLGSNANLYYYGHTVTRCTSKVLLFRFHILTYSQFKSPTLPPPFIPGLSYRFQLVQIIHAVFV